MTWMHHKYVTYIWGKLTAASCSVCVGCGSSKTWRQNLDALTHVYICTLTHSHTFYLAAWLIMASLGVLEEVQRNHFSFKKIFIFSWWFIRHRYYKINSCLSLLYYCCLGVFLPLPHVSEVTKKSQPSCGYCNKSNISTISVANWVIRWSHQTFSLAHTSLAASLCFHSQGLNNCRWAV